MAIRFIGSNEDFGAYLKALKFTLINVLDKDIKVKDLVGGKVFTVTYISPDRKRGRL